MYKAFFKSLLQKYSAKVFQLVVSLFLLFLLLYHKHLSDYLLLKQLDITPLLVWEE